MRYIQLLRPTSENEMTPELIISIGQYIIAPVCGTVVGIVFLYLWLKD